MGCSYSLPAPPPTLVLMTETKTTTEYRKKACLVKLVHRNRRGSLRGAFCSWRDGARAATALAVIERMVTKSARHKLLQT